jgi:periplasmic protein TonB
MFNTLESSWDRSPHRGWTTLASLTVQAFGLSLIIAISFIWVERPPQVHWLQIPTPATFVPVADTQQASGHHTFTAVNSTRPEQIVAPSSVPGEIQIVNDAGMGPIVPDPPTIDDGPGTGARSGIDHALGGGMPVAIPARPVAVRPLLISHLAEANLLHRVQPIYPAIARRARVQGIVELRAIISKTGTIENLVVVSGHPMLSAAAIEAVKQWRYRPYLLNNEPVEVETEITVNFLLSGG